MSKQEELIQALAEKWTAQKWGWEVDAMNEEYKEFISDLRTLLSQLVPGEGWISVKDKLPLVNDEVLTITSDGWQRIITYGSTMRGFPDLVTAGGMLRAGLETKILSNYDRI